MHKCTNNTIGNVYHLEQMVDNFFPYSQKSLGFDKPVEIIFQSDDANASKMLGKTAYYDPENFQVVLFTDGRHPKDVMRSLSHELVHHAQNCRGDFTSDSATYEGYAQEDPHLRKMEREAYTKGNLIFRDFEDLIKTGKINIEIDFSDSGEPKMSLKEWKNNEINTKLMKKWGLLKEGTAKERNDEEGNRPSDAKDMDLDEGHEHSDDCGCPDMEEGMKYRDEDIGSKAHNDEEGNRPSYDKDMDLKEDSEGEETYHYGEAEGHDEKELHDLVKRHATKAHIDALKRDMDYDEDHEDRRERGTDFREGMFSPNHYCVHHGGVQHEGRIKMAEAINHNFDKKLNKVTWYDMKLQDGTILEQVAASDIQVTNASLGEGHSHPMRDEDEDEMEEAKRHVVGGVEGVADFIMPNKPKGKTPEPGKRIYDPRHLKTKTTKVPPVKVREGKISVREAKQITRRIIERIRKEGN